MFPDFKGKNKYESFMNMLFLIDFQREYFLLFCALDKKYFDIISEEINKLRKEVFYEDKKSKM